MNRPFVFDERRLGRPPRGSGVRLQFSDAELERLADQIGVLPEDVTGEVLIAYFDELAAVREQRRREEEQSHADEEEQSHIEQEDERTHADQDEERSYGEWAVRSGIAPPRSREDAPTGHDLEAQWMRWMEANS